MKALLRLLITVAALGLAYLVLSRTFTSLDLAEVRGAIGSLQDAEIIALLAMWGLWLAAQGMQTASLLREVPVRRGVVAFVGPAAVASVIPGPSDLPVRHRMLTSWGHSSGQATLAVAAGGLFSIGIKLLLPVIAGFGLLISGAPIDGALRTIVTITVIVAIGIALVGFVLTSERHTARAGRLLDPVWRAGLRVLRRTPDTPLAERLVEARANALETLRGRWLIASWSTVLTAASRFALLLMALRFMDVGEADVTWAQVFVVYAIVQGLTVVPITAGDAGISEVALIGMLTAAAGQGLVSQVTAAVVVFRILTWLSLIPVGLVTLAGWRVLQRRRQP